MSPIGRVFIVLNLVLSGAFLGYSGFYLQNASKYKANFEAEQEAHENTKKEKDGLIAQLNSDLKKSQDSVRAQQAEIESRKQALTAAEDANTELKGRLTTLQASYEGINTSMSSMATRVDNQNQRIVEVEKLYLSAKDEKSKAIAARDQMEEELNTVKGQLSQSKSKNESLVAELSEKADNIRRMMIERDAIAAKIPNLAEILSGTLPIVDGTVLTVNDALKTVTISLGKNQAKVGTGWRFAIHDGKSYKGDISILSVDENVAIGRIVAANAAIRKGDSATTRFSK